MATRKKALDAVAGRPGLATDADLQPGTANAVQTVKHRARQ